MENDKNRERQKDFFKQGKRMEKEKNKEGES